MRTKTEYELLKGVLTAVKDETTNTEFMDICLTTMCILKDHKEADILSAIAVAVDENKSK